MTVLCAVALPILLAGCSKEPSPDPVESLGTDPLDEALSFMTDAEDLQQEELFQMFIRVEEHIAKCMKDQGFEYLPSKPTGVSHYGRAEQLRETTEEYIREYGYGIANKPLPMNAYVDQNIGSDAEDPNEEYIASLGDQGLAAYFLALNGPEVTDEEVEQYEFDQKSADAESVGCRVWAWQQEEPPSVSFSTDPLFDDLNAAIDQLYIEIQDDPKIDELEAEWSSCMAEAGYPNLPSKSTVQSMLNDEFAAFMGDTANLEEQDAFIEAFKKREIEQGLIDYRCTSEIGYWSRYKIVSDEKQLAFIEDHQMQIDAAVLAYGNQSG